MSNLYEAIKTLKTSQRFWALIILAFFTSTTAILTVYFKTDDCRAVIDENIRMQEDFAKISKILREVRLRDYETSSRVELDSVKTNAPSDEKEVVVVSNDSKYLDILDTINSITESHQK